VISRSKHYQLNYKPEEQEGRRAASTERNEAKKRAELSKSLLSLPRAASIAVNRRFVAIDRAVAIIASIRRHDVIIGLVTTSSAGRPAST